MLALLAAEATSHGVPLSAVDVTVVQFYLRYVKSRLLLNSDLIRLCWPRSTGPGRGGPGIGIRASFSRGAGPSLPENFLDGARKKLLC